MECEKKPRWFKLSYLVSGRCIEKCSQDDINQHFNIVCVKERGCVVIAKQINEKFQHGMRRCRLVIEYSHGVLYENKKFLSHCFFKIALAHYRVFSVASTEKFCS